MDNWQLVSNSLIGGNIVSITSQGLLRGKAIYGDIAFAAQKAGLSSINPSYVAPQVELIGIPVSVKTQETYRYAADVTSFPVEDGSIVSDHVILHPLKVDVVATVTNWNKGQAAYVLGLLDKIYTKRLLVDLQTTHKLIKNMVITHMEVVNELPNWGSLEIVATFQQLNFVSLQSIQISDIDSKPTERTTGKDVSNGISTKLSKGDQKLVDVPLDSDKKSLFDLNNRPAPEWHNPDEAAP